MKSDVRLRCGFLSLSVSILLAPSILGCKSDKQPPQIDAAEEERKLLEPVEQTGDYAQRCKPEPASQPVTLRAAEAGGAGGALEVGGAASMDKGFVLGVLRSTQETQAELVYLDGRGGSKITQLGRVHGAVEPPQVVAAGADAIVALVDNDAGHTRLRLAKVTNVATEGKVTWGPEVQVRRGETQTFSLNFLGKESEKSPARLLLAWDDFDKASLRSKVLGLLVDVQSMRATGVPHEISPSEEDATSPLIVSSSDGAKAFSVWLAYEDAPGERQPSEALVVEPPQSLRVQLLDAQGKPEGAPLRVTRADSNVLVYDARMLPDGSLVVAYREADSGRDEGSSPVQMSVVGLDGSIRAHTARHDELGLGAPALFEIDGAGSLWLSARARESDVLLGSLGESGEVQDFGLELALKERMPMTGRAGRLLVMEPDGLDLRFSTVLCSP